MDGRPSTAAATVADTQNEYDPNSMVWTPIPTSDSPPELPQSFKSAALTSAVDRRKEASNALRAASTDAASLATAADPDAEACTSTISPPATRSAGPQRGHKRILWHPQPLPKPKPMDSVVVLKPQTQLSLANTFPENGAGRALVAHLGATVTRLVTVVMVREQNLILVYTSNPHIADKLIGEFAVPSPAGPVPLFGYWRVDNHDSCYGVVTVHSSDTEGALRESLYWPEGAILHVRRLGTSNKVRLSFSGKVKPRYVSYDTLLIPVQAYKKKLCKPAVGVALLDIDPTPVAPPNLIFAASAERRCRSRMAPVTHMSARPGALCVLVLTSPGTGAVRNATGRRHQSRPLLHRKVKPAARSRSVDAHGSRESRALGNLRRGLSLLPHTLTRPRALERWLSGLPGEAQLRTDLQPRSLTQGRLPLSHPNRTSHHLSSNPLPRGIHRRPPAFGKRLGRSSVFAHTLRELPTQTANLFRSHTGTN
ncbi:hypothetical protein HPB48_020931 [Haemaphysalis longicornis]|uniref:Uncharacterized protein n=1 Tax=Haemaphysalis longicornis TaxID=44386 RepID=A0A9J6G255_HAELO|nr:hypothetical protein HPB48_020931 [Haemaphysalis longicornis]